MKLHNFVSVAVLLCLTTTSYAARGLNYTHDYFRSQGCYDAGCWFEVSTNEDSGGLRCRTKPSTRRSSPVVVIVPKGERVLALTLVVGEKKRAFFSRVGWANVFAHHSQIQSNQGQCHESKGHKGQST